MADFIGTSICYYILGTHCPDEANVASPTAASLVANGVSETVAAAVGGTRHSLAIVNFLRDSSGDLVALRGKPYMLSHRRHNDHPNLVLLHYDQTNSKMSEPIVREARGIILDEAQNWRPVCLPYLKFDNFNNNLHKFTPAEWAQATVYPKIDGTLATLYFASGAWHVATSNVPDASGLIHADTSFNSISFKDLFWEVWEESGYPSVSILPTNFCFMFELNTPRNRVIVPVVERRLFLHGVRDMRTLTELQPQPVADQLHLCCLQPLRFASIDAVVDAANRLSPSEGEGFVVVFGDWERVKVKSRAYVLTALLPKSETKWDEAVASDPKVMERLVRIVALGEGEEFSCAFPHVRRSLEELRCKFDGALRFLERQFEVFNGKLPQEASSKDVFAVVSASSLPKSLQGIYFQFRKGHVTDLRAALCNRDDGTLLSLVNTLSGNAGGSVG